MGSKRNTVTLYIYLPKAKKVVLSRRGKLERRGGLLQATVHGQVEPGEIPQLALKREVEEEVKGDFHALTNKRELGEADIGVTVPEHTYYFTATLDDSEVGELKTTQEVSEFIQVSKDDIGKITPYSKVKDDESFDFKANWVMYDDEIKMLRKVFDEYESM